METLVGPARGNQLQTLPDGRGHAFTGSPLRLVEKVAVEMDGYFARRHASKTTSITAIKEYGTQPPGVSPRAATHSRSASRVEGNASVSHGISEGLSHSSASFSAQVVNSPPATRAR